MQVQERRRPPIKVRDTLTIEIEGLGHAGEGVGRTNGFAVFVADAIPGDKALIRIDEVKKNFGRGTLIELLQISTQRTDPGCEVSKDCGGCQLRHMEYSAQLKWKQQNIIDALTRIGRFTNPLVEPVIGMQSPKHYRNKVHYPVGASKGKSALGFYKKGSHQLVPINTCHNVHPLCNKALQVIGPLLHKYDLSPYNSSVGKGLLRHVICRVSTTNNELMVILVTNDEVIPHFDGLLKDLQTSLPEMVTLALNINHSRSRVVLGRKTNILWGEPYLIEKINDLKFAISPNSFFQVNSLQAEVLGKQVVDYAALGADSRALDCYSGTGTLALHLAKAGANVIGVEVVADAVRDAVLNAELNGLHKTDFRVGQVETVLAEILKEGSVDAAVLDPPRKGCEPEVLKNVIEAKIPRLVYVSCNPSSLARDLALLGEGGYKLKEIQPIDMFPHTSHVEAVALLTRSRTI